MGDSPDDDLLESHDNGVVTLTFNRPARLNAITVAMFEQLLALCERVAADETARVVVLAGTGRGFCAGGDITEMAHRASESQADAVRTLRRRMRIVQLLHEMPKPTIAMTQGPAAGAGMCLALACDLRIAGPDAMFTTAFGKIGYAGDYGGSYFLPRLVGSAKARELYFTGASVCADEALAIGLVNRVVRSASLAAETQALARALADGPRFAIAQMKRNFNLSDAADLSTVLDEEAAGQIRCRLTDEHRAAAQAFARERDGR